MTLRSRWRLAIDALLGRWQQQSVPSLTAQVIARALQSRLTPTHPVRYACESYFVLTASDIRYAVDGTDFEHPVAQRLNDAIEQIAHAYITTGGVLLVRAADDALDVHDWSRVSVRIVDDTTIISVDSQVVVQWEAITFGSAALDSVRSPAEIVSVELALDSAAKEYALHVMHADPYFTRMLIPREPLSELAVRQLTESLNARGREVKGQMAVLPVPMEVAIATPTLSELQIEQLSKIAEATAAAVYGVPLQLIGLSSSAEHQTYANREQASRDYTQRVLVPFWRRVGRAVTRLYGVEVVPDLDSVEALKVDNSRYALDLYDGGNGLLSRDEARLLIGYEPVSDAGDDVAIEQSLELQEWYAQVQTTYSSLESSIAQALRQAYNDIASKINALPTKRDKLLYLYSSEFQRDLSSAIERAVDRHIPAIVEQAQRKAHRRGITYKSDPRELAQRTISEQIQQEISYRLSYTIDTLRRQIDDMIMSDVPVEMDVAHALLVARTMATGLVSYAQVHTWRAMERVARQRLRIRKMWLSQRDDRVRDSHDRVDGQIVDLDADFRVPRDDGGTDYGAHPGDSRMSAGNVINCRCVVVPRTQIAR